MFYHIDLAETTPTLLLHYIFRGVLINSAVLTNTTSSKLLQLQIQPISILEGSCREIHPTP